VNTATRKNRDVTILDCSGRIQREGVAQWRSAIMKELDGGAKLLLINLTDVEWFGADADTALGDLFKTRVDSKYGARIALLASGSVPGSLGVTDTLEYCDVFGSEDEAVGTSLAAKDRGYDSDL
jgi:hypothetical protein